MVLDKATRDHEEDPGETSGFEEPMKGGVMYRKGDPRNRDLEGMKGMCQRMERIEQKKKLTAMLTEEEMNREKNQHTKSPLQKEEERHPSKPKMVDEFWQR